MESGTQHGEGSRIILIGGEKGGTGKTTIATHLAYMRAVSGRSVMIVDADPQKSASAFCSMRQDDGRDPLLECVQLVARKGESEGATLERIATSIVALSREYDDLIIDTGGRNSLELQASIACCDAYYVPSDSSQYDILAMSTTEELLERLGGNKVALVIPNKIPHLPSYMRKQVRKLREAIEGGDYRHIKMLEAAHICHRDYIRLTPEYGATVFENLTEEKRLYDLKACQEFLALYCVIYDETSQEWRAKAKNFMRQRGYIVDKGEDSEEAPETEGDEPDADQQAVTA